MGVALSGAGAGLAFGTAHLVDLTQKSIHARAGMAVLDEAHQLISAGRVREGMDLLHQRLLELRDAGSAAWNQFCAFVSSKHPLRGLVGQDPFTLHSVRKPRGYSGDAELLDYLYGTSAAPAGTTPLGRAIFRYMLDRPGGRSVRSRRQVLARVIDETAAAFPSPKILSVACGHLREAADSQAFAEGRVGDFVAMDQDPQSLSEIERSYSGKVVRPVRASVRDIVSEKGQYQGFHLVYAAGLYDYLSDRLATKLTRMMFDMLAPGGRLLVANFAPGLPETAYMEAFMDWKLIYRSPSEMLALSAGISGDEWKSNRLFWDEHENIIFLDLVKRTSPKKAAPTLMVFTDPRLRTIKARRPAEAKRTQKKRADRDANTAAGSQPAEQA